MALELAAGKQEPVSVYTLSSPGKDARLPQLDLRESASVINSHPCVTQRSPGVLLSVSSLPGHQRDRGTRAQASIQGAAAHPRLADTPPLAFSVGFHHKLTAPFLLLSVL